MHSVLSCSRVVVRAFANGLYHIAAPLDSSDPPSPPNQPSASKVARSVRRYSTSQRPSETSQAAKPKSRFMSAKCGFSKEMLGGPSLVYDHKENYGDDACFIASHEMADVVGVADGVGGWKSRGIDPSLFPRSMMQSCEQLVRQGNFNPAQPDKIIEMAFNSLVQNCRIPLEELPRNPTEEDMKRLEAQMDGGRSETPEEPIYGSSTACLVSLDRRTGRLHSANIGDSGFLVIREGSGVVHQSREQIHYFNCPYQIGMTPPNGDFCQDSPSDADVTNFGVQDGDIILLATDGLFDNLPINMIEREFYMFWSSHKRSPNQRDLQELCNSLAFQARRIAFDPYYSSPFAKKATAIGYQFAGGKPDDITIILSLVTKDSVKSKKTQKEAPAEIDDLSQDTILLSERQVVTKNFF